MKSPFMGRKNKDAPDGDTGAGMDDVAIEVVTGDRRGAGTDCKVFVILHDDKGRTSPSLRLNKRFTTNCRAQTCTFRKNTGLPSLTSVSKIEFWLEKFGMGADWFVDRITVTVLATGKRSVFPLTRWVKPALDHTFMLTNDCLLPQETPNSLRAQRMTELGYKKAVYKYICNVPGGPAQVRRGSR
ncbi:hypothetical protein Pmani_039782 [Petrolisthes manimaculis]|uniref:PLAT domain-containing protein n=1 Tax=Petrolisthes manimaculis TaxID=1843537 RepID=A0AAE1ND25_9EUCA|nr:hypothetical protein Pmani_039782 [Petrolisthes manimaculis]